MDEPRSAEYAENLLAFLNGSPTAYHAAANAAEMMRRAGYAELRENEAWNLEAGGSYFLVRNQSAIAAFAVGEKDVAAHGFRLIGAHTDSPTFKIKPGGCLATTDGYIKLNTEGYGGAILSTWFDRPLSVAGRIAVRGEAAPRLVDLHRPVAVIPSLCIHFNRQVNDGYAYNKQIDLLPLLGMTRAIGGNGDYLLDLIAAEANVPAGSVLDYELFLHEHQPGIVAGPNNEFISAPRIDNLSMAYAGLRGLLQSRPAAHTRVFAAFDNEEVGSATPAGADSEFLPGLLRRISACLGVDTEGRARALANSLAVSADCAHAVHPNHPDKHDPENRPVLGGGPAVKYSAGQRYATNAATAAVFIQACEAAGVPWQTFVNRSDIAGGSTIGPAVARLTSIPTVDIGAAILAMHSAREFGSWVDVLFTEKAFVEFFTSSTRPPPA